VKITIRSFLSFLLSTAESTAAVFPLPVSASISSVLLEAFWIAVIIENCSFR